jgi:hypothetical protein
VSNAIYSVFAKDEKQKIIFIQDHSNTLGTKSVTNDAENVVRELQQDYAGYRIMYLDTMDNWDELVHEHGRFKSFKPGFPYAR